MVVVQGAGELLGGQVPSRSPVLGRHEEGPHHQRGDDAEAEGKQRNGRLDAGGLSVTAL